MPPLAAISNTLLAGQSTQHGPYTSEFVLLLSSAVEFGQIQRRARLCCRSQRDPIVISSSVSAPCSSFCDVQYHRPRRPHRLIPQVRAPLAKPRPVDPQRHIPGHRVHIHPLMIEVVTHEALLPFCSVCVMALTHGRAMRADRAKREESESLLGHRAPSPRAPSPRAPSLRVPSLRSPSLRAPSPSPENGAKRRRRPFRGPHADGDRRNEESSEPSSSEPSSSEPSSSESSSSESERRARRDQGMRRLGGLWGTICSMSSGLSNLPSQAIHSMKGSPLEVANRGIQ